MHRVVSVLMLQVCQRDRVTERMLLHVIVLVIISMVLRGQCGRLIPLVRCGRPKSGCSCYLRAYSVTECVLPHFTVVLVIAKVVYKEHEVAGSRWYVEFALSLPPGHCMSMFALSLPPGPFPEPAARSGAQPRGGIRGPLQVIRGTRRPHFGAKCKVQKTTPLSHTVHTGSTPAQFLSRLMACQTFAKCAFRRDEMVVLVKNESMVLPKNVYKEEKLHRQVFFGPNRASSRRNAQNSRFTPANGFSEYLIF